MLRNFTVFLAMFTVGCVSAPAVTSSAIMADAFDRSAQRTVDAAQFLGADVLQGPSHRVLPEAVLDGNFIRYNIETSDETMVITGTEQAKIRIREIYATETLKTRSTVGTMLNAVKDRTSNIVETPIRVGATLAERADDVRNVEDAVLFIPKQVGHAAGNLIDGVGELAVTGVRISRGAAGTQCSGVACVNKAGQDIWSGVNSLAGKHNAVRRLHSEFGTDPETENQSYRREVDRVAYADAYVSTSIKLGMGQAGIDYVSPAFTGVGYYNNGEFVGQYEDARRQRNREKEALLGWGAAPSSVEAFYQNRAFTKQNRRRLFAALDIIPDKTFALELFHQSAGIDERHEADSRVAVYAYIAKYEADGDISSYIGTAPAPLFVTADGRHILPVYSDYLTWRPKLENELRRLKSLGQRPMLHVLGAVDEAVTTRAAELSVEVVTVPFETRP
jgi:hypothetical protein